MADGTFTLERNAVHAAERDYANLVCQTPGVLTYDADQDIMQLAGIADQCVALARMAWNNRPRSDVTGCAEYVFALEAKKLGEVLAESLGLSREAAALLDAQIVRAS